MEERNGWAVSKDQEHAQYDRHLLRDSVQAIEAWISFDNACSHLIDVVDLRCSK